MIPVLVKSVWLRNYGRRSFSKYGISYYTLMAPQIAKYVIDIQIVRPEMTKFKMFRDMDFYFVGITF